MESITQLIGERIRIYRTKKDGPKELAEKSGYILNILVLLKEERKFRRLIRRIKFV